MNRQRGMKRQPLTAKGLAGVTFLTTLLSTFVPHPLTAQDVPELRIERADGDVEVRAVDLERGFAAVLPGAAMRGTGRCGA